MKRDESLRGENQPLDQVLKAIVYIQFEHSYKQGQQLKSLETAGEARKYFSSSYYSVSHSSRQHHGFGLNFWPELNYKHDRLQLHSFELCKWNRLAVREMFYFVFTWLKRGLQALITGSHACLCSGMVSGVRREWLFFFLSFFFLCPAIQELLLALRDVGGRFRTVIANQCSLRQRKKKRERAHFSACFSFTSYLTFVHFVLQRIKEEWKKTCKLLEWMHSSVLWS